MTETWGRRRGEAGWDGQKRGKEGETRDDEETAKTKKMWRRRCGSGLCFSGQVDSIFPVTDIQRDRDTDRWTDRWIDRDGMCGLHDVSFSAEKRDRKARCLRERSRQDGLETDDARGTKMKKKRKKR